MACGACARVCVCVLVGVFILELARQATYASNLWQLHAGIQQQRTQQTVVSWPAEQQAQHIGPSYSQVTVFGAHFRVAHRKCTVNCTLLTYAVS